MGVSTAYPSSRPRGYGKLRFGQPNRCFINQKLGQHDLTPQLQAPKHAQLRRVYIDLIGLPPTREELRRFIADDTEQAWKNVVDQLLNDPRHAERWARHWMDIWRYADWYGRRNVPDVWNSAPQVWRWRDWIVKSINDDKGYDQMIVEMLAADEICPEDYQAGYATGFLIRNWYALNPNDWMRANVEHTGKAFLGLTFNCAHCHDHKYDPISHDDYFRMRAFFEPLYVRQDRVPGEADPGPFQDYDYSTLRKVQHLGSVRAFDKTPDAPTWFYSGGDERNREEGRGSIPPGVPAFLNEGSIDIDPIQLPPSAWYPGLRVDLQQTMLDDATVAVEKAEAALANVRATAVEVPPLAHEQLKAAEANLETELKIATQSGRSSAIAGKQSLVFDATQGRRVLQNRLRSLKEFGEGFTIKFQLLLATDTHFNFQLAKDVDQGLTASLVAFQAGRIVAYHPGSFTEFDVGKYDFSAGQNRFQIQLVLQPGQDLCLLTIRSVSDEATLVQAAPIALNGWNPVDAPSKGIFLDAQTGSLAALDELTLYRPTPDQQAAKTVPDNGVHFDFEPPAYLAGQDVVGRDDWETSSFGAAPATSVVSSAVQDAKLAELEQKLESARRTVNLPELRLRSADAALVSARDELASLQARIVADQAKYLPDDDHDSHALARMASEAERKAKSSRLEADLLRDEHAVALAESKPTSDGSREKEVASSAKQLAASRDKLIKFRATKQDLQSETYSATTPVYPQTSTGRRRALARWITSRENPLTARVAVNHIWARHFHAPLVNSVYDFGLNGSKPTHPELLDWLAVELIESGWSMKHIHRLIVTSDVFRRSSRSRLSDASHPESVNVDQQDIENKLLWRMNTGRMEAEVIRDSLLHCGDLLDFAHGGQPLDNTQAMKTHRRSLYYEIYPDGGGTSEFSSLFDAPSPLECYRRTRSIVPQQALALTNSDLVHQVSTAIVSNWSKSSDGLHGDELDTRFVTEMFEQILTRLPTELELEHCLDGLRAQRELLQPDADDQASTKARESLVRVLLNHNDFVTVR